MTDVKLIFERLFPGFSFTAIQLHEVFTARIEPDVFIVQVNDIKAKLTYQTLLLILYHHVTPRSEFQGVRLFARVLQAGKSKLLRAGKSNVLQAEESKALQAGKSKVLKAGKS